MKSFLLKNNKPIVKWSLVPDNTFFEGKIPDGYALAVCPGKYIILDIDVKNGKDGFLHIPTDIKEELQQSFYYDTNSGGRHVWLDYTGDKPLMNKSTEFGLDLRIGAKPGNAGGYVKYYHSVDIRQCVDLIKPTSWKVNWWLESLFLGVNYGED